jgi:hypothetical protein
MADVMGTKRTSRADASSRNPERLLGVDFGAHTLKLVEVEPGPLGPVVKTFGIAPYARNRHNEADLVKTFETLARDAGAIARNALLVLPEPDVSLLHAPSGPTQKRLHQRVRETCLVWPMTPTTDTDGSQMHQLLCVPKTVLGFFEKVLETSGVHLAGVQHVPTALGRSFAATPRTAVLDIGANSSAWYTFDYGHLRQRATVPYGGDALTEALALANGTEREHAEEHKRSLKGDPKEWPDTTSHVVDTFLKRWWADLVRNLAEAPAYLDRIVLVGGGARSVPLRQMLFDRFGLLPEEWQLPPHAHVAESLRPHLEPHVPVLANSLALLVYSPHG